VLCSDEIFSISVWCQIDLLFVMCCVDGNSRCEREVKILGSFSRHDNFPHFLDAYGIMIMSIQ